MLHVVASPPPLPLPPWYRRRALDDLGRLIEHAEAELGRHLDKALLRLAERRLLLLRHSRELL